MPRLPPICSRGHHRSPPTTHVYQRGLPGTGRTLFSLIHGATFDPFNPYAPMVPCSTLSRHGPDWWTTMKGMCEGRIAKLVLTENLFTLLLFCKLKLTTLLKNLAIFCKY